MPDSPKSAFLRFKTAAEHFTKTDLSYLFKGGFWLIVGQIAISAIAFATSIAFAHFVSKDDYGTYRFLISIFWSLTAFGLSGIPTALSRAVAKGHDGAYWQALKLSLVGGIPMMLISIGLAGYYFLNANLLLAYGCLVIAGIGPFMQGAYLYGAFIEGKRAFRINAVGGIFLNLVPTLGLLILMMVFHDPVAFLATFLGASVLSGALISLYVIRHFSIPLHGTQDPEFRSLGFHLSAMNILFTVSQQADKLLIFHALGPINLAIYMFAVSIPDQLKALLGNIESLAFPKFAKRAVQEVLPTLGRRLWGLTGLISLVVFAYIAAAPYIFSLLFPTYSDSIIFSQIYALSLIPAGSVVPVSLLQAHAAKKELYVFNTVIPVFQIASLYIGILLFGLLGAICARIIARIVTLALSVVLVHVYAKRNPVLA